jgi:hypothetical protein
MQVHCVECKIRRDDQLSCPFLLTEKRRGKKEEDDGHRWDPEWTAGVESEKGRIAGRYVIRPTCLGMDFHPLQMFGRVHLLVCGRTSKVRGGSY